MGSKTAIGYEFEEAADLVQFEGCDMVMLGDIHLRQAFEHKGIKIAYPSSMIQQDFGERVKGHGFLIWDVEKKNFKAYDIPTEYGYFKFKISSLEDLENDKEQLMNQ